MAYVVRGRVTWRLGGGRSGAQLRVHYVSDFAKEDGIERGVNHLIALAVVCVTEGVFYLFVGANGLFEGCVEEVIAVACHMRGFVVGEMLCGELL